MERRNYWLTKYLETKEKTGVKKQLNPWTIIGGVILVVVVGMLFTSFLTCAILAKKEVRKIEKAVKERNKLEMQEFRSWKEAGKTKQQEIGQQCQIPQQQLYPSLNTQEQLSDLVEESINKKLNGILSQQSHIENQLRIQKIDPRVDQ